LRFVAVVGPPAAPAAEVDAHVVGVRGEIRVVGEGRVDRFGGHPAIDRVLTVHRGVGRQQRRHRPRIENGAVVA